MVSRTLFVRSGSLRTKPTAPARQRAPPATAGPTATRGAVAYLIPAACRTSPSLRGTPVGSTGRVRQVGFAPPKEVRPVSSRPLPEIDRVASDTAGRGARCAGRSHGGRGSPPLRGPLRPSVQSMAASGWSRPGTATDASQTDVRSRVGRGHSPRPCVTYPVAGIPLPS